MGNTPTRYGRAAVLAAASFTLTHYGCRGSSPSASTNDAGAPDATAPAPGASAPAPVVKETPPPPIRQAVIPPNPPAFPPSVPQATVSGNIPLSVPLPANITSQVQIRPNFDYFSWQSFIALNWPAKSGSRGVPDQPGNSDVFLNAAPGTPVVWGTYKDSDELFGQKDQRPTPWDSTTIPVNACPNAQVGQKTLIFLTKGNTPLMDTQQAFSYPLVDQRSNYVYFDVRYNQAQYEFIRGQDSDPTSWLYLAKNLVKKEAGPKGLQMPVSTDTPKPQVLGSIMVKAAWRIKTDKDDASRYYSTTAQVYSPQTKACAPATVLLVGLHIAHKLADFPEWVWSTFEQVDNVPPDPGVTQAPPPNGYSFNNGTGSPATPNGWDYKPSVTPSVKPGTENTPLRPVQVTRVTPIPDDPKGASTRDFNAYYQQQVLKGTVWQYYQLIVTQWPFNADQFVLMQNGGVYPRDAGGAFPVNGAVNTTMETYLQTQNDAAGAGGNSCMKCHYVAGQSDFSWGLNRRAH